MTLLALLVATLLLLSASSFPLSLGRTLHQSSSSARHITEQSSSIQSSTVEDSVLILTIVFATMIVIVLLGISLLVSYFVKQSSEAVRVDSRRHFKENDNNVTVFFNMVSEKEAPDKTLCTLANPKRAATEENLKDEGNSAQAAKHNLKRKEGPLAHSKRRVKDKKPDRKRQKIQPSESVGKRRQGAESTGNPRSSRRLRAKRSAKASPKKEHARGDRAKRDKRAGPDTMLYKQFLKSIHSVKSVSQYF